MLTLDDRKTREALIRTHDVLADPARWITGKYERTGYGAPTARCMMGEIAHQLGIRTVKTAMRDSPHYLSINAWFEANLGVSPESYNDTKGREAARDFLAGRIAELDQVLLDAAVPPLPERSLGIRSAVMTVFSIFG